MYEVPCKDWESLYFGDTGIAMEKRLAEHKNVVKKHDTSNGIESTLGPTSTEWLPEQEQQK